MEAGPEAATDFCSWKYPEPLAHAQHACAWLGACESPLGRNAFGSCMFNALLAYDCTTNPGHPVQGKTHELWDCLWQAQSCNAVTACVFPKGPQRCDGTGTGCGNVDGSAPNNLDVRVDCVVDGGEAKGENCALWGQTCAPKGGVCSGSSDPSHCQDECDGTNLHKCTDAGDVGIDCAGNGAQQCKVFGTGTQWAACLPSGDAGPCTPDASATCVSGIATSCPAGRIETIDCLELLSSTAACNPGPLSPAFDWTSPCAIVADASADASPDGGPDAGGCTESCSGTTLTGCYRGAAFQLDCAEVGLGACQAASAACTPPP